MVKSIAPILPEDVGSGSWQHQQHNLEALNVQAHVDAKHGRNEFVKSLIVGHDKMSLLVANLIVSESWLDKAYPDIKDQLSTCKDPVLYLAVLRQEVILANLIEIFVHHADAATAMSEESAIELVEWAVRKLHWLDNEGRMHSQRMFSMSAKEMLQQTPLQELARQLEEIRFSTCMSSITIMRHLSEHGGQLALGVTHRMTVKYSMATAVVAPLVLDPPWEQLNSKGIFRWEDGTWHRILDIASRSLSSASIQSWLLLYNLILDPVINSKTSLSDVYVNALLRLRGKLTASVVEQVPILASLQRFIDNLASGAFENDDICTPNAIASPPKVIIIEQTPQLRHALLHNVKWSKVVERLTQEYMPAESALDSQTDRLEQFLDFVDFASQSLHDDADPKKYTKLLAPSVRLEVFVKVDGRQWSWHSSYCCAIRTDTRCEDVVVKKDLCGSESKRLDSNRDYKRTSYTDYNSDAIASTTEVKGKRYRLKHVMHSGAQCLPCHGKIFVHFGDFTLEAIFELPEPETR